VRRHCLNSLADSYFARAITTRRFFCLPGSLVLSATGSSSALALRRHHLRRDTVPLGEQLDNCRRAPLGELLVVSLLAVRIRVPFDDELVPFSSAEVSALAASASCFIDSSSAISVLLYLKSTVIVTEGGGSTSNQREENEAEGSGVRRESPLAAVLFIRDFHMSS